MINNTQTQPLVFLGVISSLHREDNGWRELLIVDAKIQDLVLGDSLKTVSLISQLIPGTRLFWDSSGSSDPVVLIPGDRVVVAAEAWESSGWFSIRFIRFLESPFQESSQQVFLQTSFDLAAVSWEDYPSSSLAELYSMVPRKFEPGGQTLEDLVSELKECCKRDWLHKKYRWAHN
jgi:hypothetical protein